MSEAYIELIKKQQAVGPYLLSGWSMGARIALEVAAQLEQQGEKIQFLGLIDSSPIPSVSAPLDPLSCRLLLLGGWLSRALAQSSEQPCAAIFEELRTLPTEEACSRLKAFLLGEAEFSSALSEEVLQRQEMLLAKHLELLRHHQPKPVQVPIHAFWARTRSVLSPMMALGEPFSLNPYTCGGVTEVWLEGDHFSVLQPPQVETLAALLLHSIKGALKSLS